MSSIKPKIGECIDCGSGAAVTYIIAKRCVVGKNHYKRHQQDKQRIKQANKPVVVKVPKTKAKAVLLNQKSVQKLLLLAQEAFNAFIRQRDLDGDHFVCISCGVTKSKDQLNAGHFYSAGNHSYLRFNENNCHSQCIRCNCHLHGNLLPYRENLIKKIGLFELQKLDAYKNISQPWNKIQLIALIQLYKNKVKNNFF